MFTKKLNMVLAGALFFASAGASAKVHWNVKIRDFKEEASFHLDDYRGKRTFLDLMKKVIYPAIEEQWRQGNYSNRNHVSNVAQGNGVELRLSDEVSTYHAKFKDASEDKAERSGRSFSAVGKGPRVKYVADASYLHYLRHLEEISENRSELMKFYSVVLNIIAKCDARGIEDLEEETQRVAADFVAVYIAEQYRHLISGTRENPRLEPGSKLGRRHNWDDALLQVTLLAAFHSGQSDANKSMYYEANYSKEVWSQFICVYNQRWKRSEREENAKRNFNLTDYWQFGKTCSRSGVNVTRRDFQRLGGAITDWLDENRDDLVENVADTMGTWGDNLVQDVGYFFINNRTDTRLRNADTIVGAIMTFLNRSRQDANKMSLDFMGTFRGRSSDQEVAVGTEDKYFDAQVSEAERAWNKAMLAEEELDADLQ